MAEYSGIPKSNLAMAERNLRMLPATAVLKIADLQNTLASNSAAIIVSETSLKKSQHILKENKIADVPVLTWEIPERM